MEACEHRIGNDDTEWCRRGDVSVTGTQAALGYMYGESFGRRCSTWGRMEEKHRWRCKEKAKGEREVVIDLVEEWHDAWTRRE